MNQGFFSVVLLYATLLGAKKLTSMEDKEIIEKVIDEEALTPSEFKTLQKYDNSKLYSFQSDDENIKQLYAGKQQASSARKKTINNHLKEIEDCFLAFKISGYPRCLSPLAYSSEQIKNADSSTREGIATTLLQAQLLHQKKYPWEIKHPLLDSYFEKGMDTTLHAALEQQVPLHVKTKKGEQIISPIGIVPGSNNEPMIVLEDEVLIPFEDILEVSIDPSISITHFESSLTKDNLVLGAHKGLVYLCTPNSKEGMIQVIEKKKSRIELIVSPRCTEEVTEDDANFIKLMKWPWNPPYENIVIVSDEIYHAFKDEDSSCNHAMLKSKDDVEQLHQELSGEIKTSKDKYETFKCIKQIKEIGIASVGVMPVDMIRKFKRNSGKL